MKNCILALICLIPAAIFAQSFQWTTFTSTSNVVDMVESQGKVWTATSGGLSGYDPVSRKFDIYTNTRGLAMNQTAAVAVDSHGFIWAGLGDARITRINPQTQAVRQVVDLQNDVFQINAILPVGDEVFVAANNGIYRFRFYPVVDDYRVFEAIKAIGNFPGETRVNALAVCNGYLYAGTVVGLARVSLSQPQLNAPDEWTTFNQVNSPLPENIVVALQGYPDPDSHLLNIATPNWVASLVDTTWTTQHVAGVVDFADGDYRWAVSDYFGTSSVWREDAPQGQWRTAGPPLSSAVRIAVLPVSGDSDIVLGLSDSGGGSGGLVLSPLPNDATVWGTAQSAAGIGGNFITALAMDPQGNLWAGGSGPTSGVYVRRGDAWTNFNRSTGYQQQFFNAHPTSFAFDDFGGIWVGSMGAGLAWFHGLDSITFFDNWGDSSGYASVGGSLRPRLTGINTDPQNGLFYIETYVARDGGGNIFISNLEVHNDSSVMVAPRDWISRGNNPAPWTYYVTPFLQPPRPRVDYAGVGKMIADPLQRLWIGPGRNGIRMYVLDTHGTLADTTDDQWWAFAPSAHKDNVTCFDSIATEVLDWAVDGAGYLWVGTTNGAYYTQGGVTSDPDQIRFICLDLPLGQRVNAVHVDGQDNKWFGTDDGVAVLDKDFNWVYEFQTAGSANYPSGLVSNNVLAITSNPTTGEVWIGTQDGLSAFTSPFIAAPLGDHALKAFPSPFVADGRQHMHVNHDAGHFDELRILTISGRLVRKLTWNQMIDSNGGSGWDGTNENGDPVAGGVYILIASSNDGKSALGKAAVLGR